MSDPVITDEEKDALLDGVENGDVEVQADGETAFANVQEFEFPARSRIVSNSFPRLTVLNEQLAIKASRRFEKLLNTSVVMRSTGIDVTTFGALGIKARTAILEISMEPLDGTILLSLNADFMGRLVEAFFGGSGDNPPHVGAEGFTAGELNVAGIFGRELFAIVEATWASVEPVKAEVKGVRQETDIIEVIEPTDEIIVCNFDIELLGGPEFIQLLLPSKVVEPLVPAFEGRKRDRDPVEDARWESEIRAGVVATQVAVTSTIGEAKLTLRDIVNLKPGDVIDIDNPRNGFLLAASIPVMAGRFGVHDGCYAMETMHWLGAAKQN